MTPHTKALAWTGTGALVVAFVLFAPLKKAAICVDAQDTSKSYCRHWQMSLIGIETTVWVWLVSSIVLVGIAFVVAGGIGRRRASNTPD